MKRHQFLGFTLIELLVTLAIMGVLAVLVVPVAEVSIQRTREHDLRLALREIRSGLDAYKRAVEEGRVQRSSENSAYPKSLKLLVDGVTDLRSPKRVKIYFLRNIPRDPMSTDPNIGNAETWGLRSYISSHEEPREGEDVFDIYSKSPILGLNGIPYRQW